MADGQKRSRKDKSASDNAAVKSAKGGKPAKGAKPTKAASAGKASKSEAVKAKAVVSKAKEPKAKESKQTVKPLAAKLLEMHLKSEMETFTPDRVVAELREEVSTILDLTQHIRLVDLVTPDQVMAVIKRNVINLKIAGGVTELAGDMANRVYTSTAHRDTMLKDIMNARQFEEFVEKFVSLKSHRQRVVSQILAHPVYSELVSQLMYQGIVRYISKHNLTGSNIPGVAAMFKFGKQLVDKAAPDLEAGMEASLKGFIGKNMRFFVQQSESFINETLTDASLKGTIMDFWDVIENKPMKSFQEGMDTLDLSEFVVLGYEFWLKYRKTKHFKQACQTVVEGFYEKFGDEPISDLLEEMGVTRAMIMTELEEFAPRVMELLNRDGFLEGRLRRRLERFYFSEQVQELL